MHLFIYLFFLKNLYVCMEPTLKKQPNNSYGSPWINLFISLVLRFYSFTLDSVIVRLFILRMSNCHYYSMLLIYHILSPLLSTLCSFYCDRGRMILITRPYNSWSDQAILVLMWYTTQQIDFQEPHVSFWSVLKQLFSILQLCAQQFHN